MSEDEIGRAAHVAWKRLLVEQGYADHKYVLTERWLIEGLDPCGKCGQLNAQHHPDMIDWDKLPPAKRQKYIVQGMAGYEARQGPEDIEADYEMAKRDPRGIEWLRTGWIDARQRAQAAEAQVAALTALFSRHMKAAGFTDSAIEAGLREAALATDPARETPPDA